MNRPYTAARHAKEEALTATGVEGFGAASDRRVTDGPSLIHARLDGIEEDVRANRRDIARLRERRWEGGRLGTRGPVEPIGENEIDRTRRDMHRWFDILEDSQRELTEVIGEWIERRETAARRRRIRVAIAAGTSSLVIGALLRPTVERAVAALFGG